eukprot:TRINITY_DN9966_c0_g1_i1.p1 TRINITY_DN9966_c0_g1~~TRINITY_DN9966_c0_g1_i1.p1  ORF type:complete len:427 (+),score=80.80 TRINITY_DN9966_c0_g1_i1:150-1430(+)
MVQKQLLFGIVLNMLLWCLLVGLYIFFYVVEDDVPNVNSVDYINVNSTLDFLSSVWHDRNATYALRPVIWISGLKVTFREKDEEGNSTWMAALPRLFFERYPNARIIVATTNTSIFNVTVSERPLWLVEWRRIDMGNNTWVAESYPRSSLQELGDLTVDIHFVDNSKKMGVVINYYAPWLFDPRIVRVIYPGSKRYQLEYADLVVATNSYLKPFPTTEIQAFDQLITQRKLIPDTTKQYPFKKDDLLFYPSSISWKKGQLRVAQLIDAELVNRFNLTIVFAGKLINESYWQQVQEVLNSKSIRYIYLGFVEDHLGMADLFIRSRVIVHYSEWVTTAPNMVYEGLFANTPFLVSDFVQLDPRVKMMGGVVERSALNATMEAISFNEKLESVLTQTWGSTPRAFAKKVLSFESLFARIECLLAAKRKL